MPNLRYQYTMNEPFIGGSTKIVQSSHDANVHKIRVAYELDIEEEAREEQMSFEEQIQRQKEEDVRQIESMIKDDGTEIALEDLRILNVDYPGQF